MCWHKWKYIGWVHGWKWVAGVSGGIREDTYAPAQECKKCGKVRYLKWVG